MIKIFSPKLADKLTIKLKKMFPLKENIPSEIIIEENADMAVFDTTQVFMCIAKSEEAKRILLPFIDKEKDFQIPKMTYSKDRFGFSKYGAEYLSPILDFFKAFERNGGIHESDVLVETNDEYPLTISNTHFSFIVAPRV